MLLVTENYQALWYSYIFTSLVRVCGFSAIDFSSDKYLVKRGKQEFSCTRHIISNAKLTQGSEIRILLQEKLG